MILYVIPGCTNKADLTYTQSSVTSAEHLKATRRHHDEMKMKMLRQYFVASGHPTYNKQYLYLEVAKAHTKSTLKIKINMNTVHTVIYFALKNIIVS